jgi:UDP-glucose 4-epimerase
VDTLDTNIRGSANVLAAASGIAGVYRVICFSTSEIYGRHALGAKEGDPAVVPAVGAPRWAYAAGKLAEEHYAFAYQHQFGLPVTVVRPFNVYGPGQSGEGAVANFARAALTNSPIEIRNGGTQVRAWCYVDDLLDGVILAATRPEGNGQVFNIGNPKEVESTVGLAKRIIDLAGSQSAIEHVASGAEVEERSPDITKACDLLGYEPTVDLTEGLTRTIASFRRELE